MDFLRELVLRKLEIKSCFQFWIMDKNCLSKAIESQYFKLSQVTFFLLYESDIFIQNVLFFYKFHTFLQVACLAFWNDNSISDNQFFSIATSFVQFICLVCTLYCDLATLTLQPLQCSYHPSDRCSNVVLFFSPFSIRPPLVFLQPGYTCSTLLYTVRPVCVVFLLSLCFH